MTVATAFHSWQDEPLSPDPKRCAPICSTWMAYLLDRWGGQSLGCYASRPIVGGSSPSSHASGAAIDWRYENPGPGRDVLMGQVLPFLINNSQELGVNAIHDYAGRRIWRPPNCSGRPAEVSPECGWRGSSGSQMQPWATWIHVECLDTRWSDTRSVDEMLGEGDDMPLSQEDIDKISDASAEKVWAKMIDTTTADAGIEPQAARYLLQRTFLIVREYLGGFPGKPAEDPSTLQQIWNKVK